MFFRHTDLTLKFQFNIVHLSNIYVMKWGGYLENAYLGTSGWLLGHVPIISACQTSRAACTGYPIRFVIHYEAKDAFCGSRMLINKILRFVLSWWITRYHSVRSRIWHDHENEDDPPARIEFDTGPLLGGLVGRALAWIRVPSSTCVVPASAKELSKSMLASRSPLICERSYQSPKTISMISGGGKTIIINDHWYSWNNALNLLTGLTTIKANYENCEKGHDKSSAK